MTTKPSSAVMAVVSTKAAGVGKEWSVWTLLIGHKLGRGRGTAMVSTVHGHVLGAFTSTEKSIGTHAAHRDERAAVLATSTAPTTEASRTMTTAHSELRKKRRRGRRVLAVKAHTRDTSHIHANGTHISPLAVAHTLHTPVMGLTATSTTKRKAASHTEAVGGVKLGVPPFTIRDGSSRVGLRVGGRGGSRVGLGSSDLFLGKLVGSNLVVRGMPVVSVIMAATRTEKILHILCVAIETRLAFEFLKRRRRVGTMVSVLVTSAINAFGKFTTMLAMLVVLAEATTKGKPRREKLFKGQAGRTAKEYGRMRRHKARRRTHEATRAVEVRMVAIVAIMVGTSRVIIVIELSGANSEVHSCFNYGWQKVSNDYKVDGVNERKRTDGVGSAIFV